MSDYNYEHGDCQDRAIGRLLDGVDQPAKATEAQVWATLAVAAAINRLADVVASAGQPPSR